MRKISLLIIILSSYFNVSGQMIKINAPILGAMPNIAGEIMLNNQFTANLDFLYSPFLLKKTEQVLKFINTSLETRYYFKTDFVLSNYERILKNKYAKNLVDENMGENTVFSGLYIGPYAQYSYYNIGLSENRYLGQGVAIGAVLGYQLFFSKHWAIDFNIGIGYAHMFYQKYKLGACYTVPLDKNASSWWIGPTKIGVSIAYFIKTKKDKK